MAQLILQEGAAPSTPATGTVTFYAKTDGKIYYKDDTGAETELGAATGVAFLGVAQEFTAQQTPMNGDLVDDTNISWDANVNGQVVKLTIGGNRTMSAPTNIVENNLYLIRIQQDATGGRTLTWDSSYKFPAATAPTLTSAANSVDIFSFVGGAANTLEYIGQDVR